MFLFFQGDAAASGFVMCIGIVLYYYPTDTHPWALYLDPGGAMIIMLLIAKSAYPLTKECCHILMNGECTSHA
jgi:Co/Zn/Cd efflux system component